MFNKLFGYLWCVSITFADKNGTFVSLLVYHVRAKSSNSAYQKILHRLISKASVVQGEWSIKVEQID